jgi:hypothetical protein
MPAWPQHRVDDSNSYHRIICIVPLIGSGKWDDPKRPMFAPVASQIGRGKSGILAYYHEMTDNGQAAIVVFVVADRAVLQPILTSAVSGVQVFDLNATSPLAAQAALTSVRKDFDWKRFAVRVQ